MKFFLRIVSLVFTGLFFSVASAQDVHFSQYNASPLLLNPALAGLSDGDYRVYMNYRMQWPTIGGGSTYRTFAGGADMAIGNVTKYKSFAGIGISFFSDQAGAINLSTDRISLTFAYHLMLNRKGTQQLSAGIQGSFDYMGINPSLATYDEDYNFNTGQYNPYGPKETFGKTNVLYGDAGLGVLYNAMFRNVNFYTGFALDHINQPNVSFEPEAGGDTNDGQKLYMKITLHGGLSIPLGGIRNFILPNYLVLFQGPTQEFDAGCSFKTLIGTDARTSTTAFYIGAQYRGLLDAIIFNTRIDIKGFSGGFSYDVNISKLEPASHTVGAPEIALSYHWSSKKRPRSVFCPVMF